MARAKVDYSSVRLPVRLLLYDQGGSLLGDVSRRLAATWERSVRAIGGYWMGQAQYEGSPDEMRDLFQTGLQYEIKETAGGLVTWEGFLAEMRLTLNGITYTRSWSDVANRVKATYSRIGINQVTNPSCESGAWAAYGSPPTLGLGTSWASEGAYSCYIVTNAANQGAVIQTGMSITAGRAYQGRVSVYIVSGTWRLELYDGSGTVIEYTDTSMAGESVMFISFDETRFTSAATLSLRLYCTDAAGEIFADAAVFQEAPARAETRWYNDLVSQSRYGIIEDVLMLAGTTDKAADATAQRSMQDRAYARTRPPAFVEIGRDRSRLELTFAGWVFTLRNRMTTLRGSEAAASTQVAASVYASQYINRGSFQTNAMLYRVEDRDGYRAWNVIADITAAGDASYNRWVCGVSTSRQFYYRQADTNPVARVQNGRVIGPGGGMLEGWLAQPGYVQLDDLPIAYDAPSRLPADLNRLAWFDEVVWSLPDYLEDGSGVRYQAGGLDL